MNNKNMKTGGIVLAVIIVIIAISAFWDNSRKTVQAENNTAKVFQKKKFVYSNPGDTIPKNLVFKKLQMKYPNVKTAYSEKEALIKKKLEAKNIDYKSLQILLRVIKQEELVELWAKDKTVDTFTLYDKFKICLANNHDKLHGMNLLIPEGLYFVEKFEPFDPYYSRLVINFPNKIDKTRHRTGNGIAMHGGCFSTYCTPLTDNDIKEIYVMAIEAKTNGQDSVPIFNFPARLDDANFEKSLFTPKHGTKDSLAGVWKNLKVSYDYFEKNRKILPYSQKPEGIYYKFMKN